MSDRTNYKEYLGDGVYADYDGYHVSLKTNSPDRPDNTIYLDDRTAEQVVKYLKWAFEIED